MVAGAVVLFRGDNKPSVPITVLSDRAGLQMNVGAKVKLHGAQVGSVTSIVDLPTGQAALHLGIDPSWVTIIPSNVLVDISSNTVFGAKSVQLVTPPQPSADRIRVGQVLDASNVTVEVNTIFDHLTSILSKVDPAKLNATIGAIGTAFNGRGEQLGQTLDDFDKFLAAIEPNLPALNHDLEVAPDATGAYADAAADLMTTVDNGSRISQTIVDEQHNLDAVLVSLIGLADVGNDVIGSNRAPLTNVLQLLVPTTALLDRYHEAVTCALVGAAQLAKAPPLPVPGANALTGFTFGMERYRYPGNLPKVAASGGPQCAGQLPLQPDSSPPFVLTDTNANPYPYENTSLVLNSDGLKKFLFGEIDGPPRNTAQIGQPG